MGHVLTVGHSGKKNRRRWTRVNDGRCVRLEEGYVSDARMGRGGLSIRLVAADEVYTPAYDGEGGSTR